MIYSEFLDKLNAAFAHGSNVRLGQHFFNMLYAYHPVLAEKLRGTTLDPFQSDSLLDIPWKWVEEHWNDT
jgi:hypothetical protein